MKIFLSYLLLVSFFLTNGCAEDKKSDASNDQQAAASESGLGNSVSVEEDSEPKLSEFIASLRALQQAAQESPNSGAYSEISQNASNLATHLEFEVAPHVAKAQYRDAAYDWDFGDLYAARLEKAYTANDQAQQELASNWQAYSELKETLLELKKRWNRR